MRSRRVGSESGPSPSAGMHTIEVMRSDIEFRDMTAAQLTERLRAAVAKAEPFDAAIVFELAERAETGERLQRRVAQDALREIAPVNGYVPGDF